ncbi:MAG: prepilin-type N-terminal cleavage/methylation domain-containing protein [Pyrinomonadaceae bacterium]
MQSQIESTRTAEIDAPRRVSEAAGFTLIEVAVAMVIMFVALLGVAFAFSYAINYNTGNNSRSQAIAVMQQEVEQVRAAKFTPTSTDPLLQGGVKTPRTVTTTAGLTFLVRMDVDNDPFTAGVQDESTPTTLKEITITVRLANPSPGWQLAVPATVVLRRARAN